MIYLHIGRARSGSSTIQNFVQCNAAVLVKGGTIAIDFRRAHRATKALHISTAAPELASLAATFAAAPDSTFLFSSEFLSSPTHMDLPRVRMVRELVGAHDVRILTYLRDYPSFAVSLYKQRTRAGRSADDFDRSLAHMSLSAIPNLELWIEVFGPEKVTVRSLASLRGNSLIADFAAEVGVASLPNLTYPDNLNVSESWPLIELARFLTSRTAPRRDPHSRRTFRQSVLTLGSRMMGEDATPSVQYLTPDQQRTLREAYNNDVRAINALLPDHSLPLLDERPIDARPFVPSLANVPAECLTRLRTAAGDLNFRRRIQNIPDAVMDMLRDGVW